MRPVPPFRPSPDIPIGACLTACAAVLLPGCALLGRLFPPAPPDAPVEVRFHLALASPAEGFTAAADEAGRPLYVAAEPFLTEADIALASVYRSSHRNLLLLELLPGSEITLESFTAEHVGHRLAIYLDGRLVMSPVIRGPLRQGKVYLDGDFGAAEAARLADRLNARRSSRPPPGVTTAPALFRG